MQDQPTAGTCGVLGQDEIAQLVLTVLLDRHPALVSIEELVRHFDYRQPKDRISDIFVREAVDELRRSGLAHQLGEFAFASHSGVQANKLTA